MGILEGKKLVITGVLTDASLAFGVAKLAIAEGAEVGLTGAGRAITLTQRTARKLDPIPPVFEFDVTRCHAHDGPDEVVTRHLDHELPVRGDSRHLLLADVAPPLGEHVRSIPIVHSHLRSREPRSRTHGERTGAPHGCRYRDMQVAA